MDTKSINKKKNSMSLNPLQEALYNALDTLVASPETPFVSSIHEKDGKHYRIFVYQIASYKDFLAPYSREGRGLTFEVKEDGKTPVRLASLTPHKFFNDSENEFTKNLDYSNIELIMDKLDGSIMSTYKHVDTKGNIDVFLKSKGSLSSDQAKAANKLLNTEAYKPFKNFLFDMVSKDITVSMEFTSNKPEFRVVLKHDDERLTVFSARKHDDLSYIKYDNLKALMASYGVADKLVPNYREQYKNDFPAFITSIKDMQDDIEGYVVVIENGETVKLKTLKYAERHKMKGDAIDSPKQLFELVVREEHDDLRGSFPDDAYLMDLIDDMEKRVKEAYSTIYNTTVSFYEKNKNLSVKDYAILGMKSNLGYCFQLAMNLRNDKENDYKEFLLSHWKDFRDGTLMVGKPIKEKIRPKFKV